MSSAFVVGRAATCLGVVHRLVAPGGEDACAGVEPGWKLEGFNCHALPFGVVFRARQSQGFRGAMVAARSQPRPLTIAAWQRDQAL